MICNLVLNEEKCLHLSGICSCVLRPYSSRLTRYRDCGKTEKLQGVCKKGRRIEFGNHGASLLPAAWEPLDPFCARSHDDAAAAYDCRRGIWEVLLPRARRSQMEPKSQYEERSGVILQGTFSNYYEQYRPYFESTRGTRSAYLSSQISSS
ncbi:hypothetical protein PV04_09932 [Phialophora macrospora]|uniref:Uncharacterized protein n=1 Tax=Phialophora macrospora TaxID=1851006 RepID=A0A0D2FSP1_9EURO|nr:hypothetical protein PV04_09932 [Phialophora macrospora]